MEPDTHERVELLHRISKIVSSDLTLEKILEELVLLTVTATRGDACLVYFVDHSTSEIVLCASRLPDTSEMGKIRLKMREGVTSWVVQHRSVVALEANAASNSRFKSFQVLPGAGPCGRCRRRLYWPMRCPRRQTCEAADPQCVIQ